jgi:hypothetical protein
MKYFPQNKEECHNIKCSDCVRKNTSNYKKEYCPKSYCVFVCNITWKSFKEKL